MDLRKRKLNSILFYIRKQISEMQITYFQSEPSKKHTRNKIRHKSIQKISNNNDIMLRIFKFIRHKVETGHLS